MTGEPCAQDFECARKLCIAESSRAGIPQRVSLNCIEVGNQNRANRLTIATMKPFDPEPVSFLQVVSLTQNLEIAFEEENG
jgi:hypothetical protein